MRTRRSFSTVSCTVLLVLAFPSRVAAAPEAAPGITRRPLAIDDLFGLQSVSEPQISPDGHFVAYVVSSSDLEEDATESALWMVPVGATTGEVAEPWRLTAPGTEASRPRWSPDGRRLAFLGSRQVDDQEAKTQVWSFDLRGGDAQPLTEVAQGVDSFDFSPVGRRLLLVLRDPKPEDLLDDAEREKKKPEPHVIDRLQFKRDNRGYLDRRRRHLFIFDLATKALRQITSGDYDDDQAAWSPDGKLVAFSSNRTAEPDGNGNRDLWIVAADNTDQGATLRRVTTNPGADASPVWSPDGASLAYLTITDLSVMWYATVHLAVIPATGGEPRLLTVELDRNASEPRFSADGRTITFLLEDSGASHLARIRATGGGLERQVGGDRVVSSYSVAGDGTIVVGSSEPQLPDELFIAAQGGLRALTRTNRGWLAALELGRVENIHFPSPDGTEIEGFLTFPPGYDPRLTYPAILRLHGGPVSQYDFAFEFESQILAAHGYLVIRANPRGSSGYGQAFSAALFADWGNKDFQDVMAAVDYAVAKGYADPHRLGVGGWSYGGILTNYVITQTDRFRAAISGASEVLYVANYGHDHYQLEWEQELGLPWENRELWERLSPFNRVEKIVTPTLIVGGELDWNVPVLNSEQLYQALRRLGRTTQLIVYPGEHHGIRRLSFQKDRYERYLDWYDRYVKQAETDRPMAAGGEGR